MATTIGFPTLSLSSTCHRLLSSSRSKPLLFFASFLSSAPSKTISTFKSISDFKTTRTSKILPLWWWCYTYCCCWVSFPTAIVHSFRTPFLSHSHHHTLSYLVMAPRSLRSSSSSSAVSATPPSKAADEEEDEDKMNNTKQESISPKVDGPNTTKQKRAAPKTTVSAATLAKTNTEKKAKKGRPQKSANNDDDIDDDDDDASQRPLVKKKKKAAAAVKVTPPPPPSAESDNNETTTKKKPAKKAPPHQVLTQREDLPKLWDAAAGSYAFKIASWNVAGLRALIKKTPTVLVDLVVKHNLDCLCLQETKLNDVNVDDPKLNIPKLEEHGYEAYYSCSTAKKGYSGTAVFVRKHKNGCKISDNMAGAAMKKKKQSTLDSFLGTTTTKKSSEGGSSIKKSSGEDDDDTSSLPIDAQLLIPEHVSYKMGIDKHDQEGRIVVVDFPLFTMANVYVPNSGQNLERLDYRTKEWDKDLLAFMQSRQQQQQGAASSTSKSRPVLWCGDLNVAHTNLEVWNDGAKHLPKQAGVTAQERASFQAQLDAGGFVDAFRRLHPTAQGHYSYWSQRAGNRGPNKGLRLDYFVCDPSMFHETSKVVVRDSYMIFDQEGSDHCPVVLELEIKP